jgi:hypothetical protein
LPGLSINDTSAQEGDYLVFTISLDAPATQQVSFNVAVDEFTSDATP